jgi:hypothetical protein
MDTHDETATVLVASNKTNLFFVIRMFFKDYDAKILKSSKKFAEQINFYTFVARFLWENN